MFPSFEVCNTVLDIDNEAEEVDMRSPDWQSSSGRCCCEGRYDEEEGAPPGLRLLRSGIARLLLLLPSAPGLLLLAVAVCVLSSSSAAKVDDASSVLSLLLRAVRDTLLPCCDRPGLSAPVEAARDEKDSPGLSPPPLLA